MALTLAQLQTNRDSIDSAIGKGELSVTFSDRTVMYRSVSDLKRARDIIDSDILKLSGRAKQSLGVGSKGF